ncbi:uncharacterized protein F4807DRAFT_469755 [Annulohypoxylon truncatum]|uniref:uncharacterized protein n=1 Tax=Annulohypoxylon truncatum TaxID=327061 RepID=UPI002007668B|nr:uncharacterized protein F4807DRAFT_469755 [Annulohypoxylon truncatum]KAI1206980.1 hypothetical protein F4807DRAFT_469755 [Annulohypoxylon truncatum]
MNLAPKANGQQKYKSKYFPMDNGKSFPEHILFYGAGDNLSHNNGFFIGFAEAQIKLRRSKGILLTRLWSDAYDALDAEQQSGVYRYYLMWVRKLAGMMLAEELDPEKVRNRAPLLIKAAKAIAKADHNGATSAQAFAQVPKTTIQNPSTTAPSQRPVSLGMPQGKSNPPAAKFPPMTPVKKENEKPRPAEPKSMAISNFEERCRKLGLRFSSSED